MKKLLSLLSVLTISGAAVPTTISASPYQKEKNKLENSDINYLQTNNIESLIRIKRENNNYIKTKIVKVDNWNPNKFLSDLCKNVLTELLYNGIIKSISDINNDINFTCDTQYFVINNQTQYTYFIVPFSVERGDQSVVIDLIFRSSDFYIQGFTYNGYYNHFSDSTIRNMPNQISRNFNFDSNYNTLIGDSDFPITWIGIHQAFNDLINYGENPDYQGNISVIKSAWVRVVLATAESMRFRQVRTNIVNSNTQTFYWQNDFYEIIKNWSSITQSAINYLIENKNLNNFVSRNVILIFMSTMFYHLNQCNNRNQRSLNNNLICYKDTQNFSFKEYFINSDAWTPTRIEGMEGTVTATAVFQKTNSKGNIKAGSLYVATTKGLYYFYLNFLTPSKINGVNGIITDINLTPNGSAYLKNKILIN